MSTTPRARQLWDLLMRPSDHPDRRAPARQGLARLLLLRACIAALGAAALPVFQLFSPAGVSPVFAAALVACALTSALLGYWRLRTAPVITHRELFGHLLADVALLVVLLANTGGIGNPLISYLLVLLAAAATLLPKPLAYAFAAGCILIYTFFLALDIRTGHAPAAAAPDQDAAFRLHLVGMWVIFLVSAVLISVLGITYLTPPRGFPQGGYRYDFDASMTAIPHRLRAQWPHSRRPVYSMRR